MFKKMSGIISLLLFIVLIGICFVGFKKDKSQRVDLLAKRDTYNQTVKKEDNKNEKVDKKGDEKKETEKSPKKENVSVEDKIKEMTILTLGDGISKDGLYQDKLKKIINPKDIVNKANSGLQIKTMASAADENSIKSANITLIHCGINDYTKSLEIGNINDSKEVESYYGNLKYLTESINAINPEGIIILMTPQKHGFVEGQPSYPDPNYLGYTLDDYASAILKYGEANSIPVIDLFNESGIESANISEYTVDNLTLNESGATKIATLISEKFKTIIK